MKIHVFKFALTCGLVAATLWILCGLLVMLMYSAMLPMPGDMLHMEPADMGWHLTWSDALKGFVACTVAASAGGWLLATIYNRLL